MVFHVIIEICLTAFQLPLSHIHYHKNQFINIIFFYKISNQMQI